MKLTFNLGRRLLVIETTTPAEPIAGYHRAKTYWWDNPDGDGFTIYQPDGRILVKVIVPRVTDIARLVEHLNRKRKP